jgi:hypothetical protein
MDSSGHDAPDVSAEAASKPRWACALELAPDRSITSGSYEGLSDAIGRGADLRVYTEFRHEEHIAPFKSGAAPEPENAGLIREVIDFREALLVDGTHVAGITLLRQPLEPTKGFNGRQPKMSFFMYNMDGHQSCANLVLDDAQIDGEVGTRSVMPAPPHVPKMSDDEVWDLGTSGPSRNFVYNMEVYRFWVCDEWEQVLAHDSDGVVTSGSFEALERAQIEGREIKVGIRDLCADLRDGPTHEVFSLLGSGFVHTQRRFYETLTHPLVRVAPAVPMRYASGNWDVSWVFLRTDGCSTLRTLNPYTRTFSDRDARFACRWFVR